MKKRHFYICFNKEQYEKARVEEVCKTDLKLLGIASEWVNDRRAYIWTEEDFNNSLSNNDPSLFSLMEMSKYYQWRVVEVIIANSVYKQFQKKQDNGI